MDVRARRVARRTGIGNDLALRDGLTFGDGQFLIVAVKGRQAVAVVDDDGIAVAADPAGFDDDTAVGCVDGRTVVDADIDAAVIDRRPEDRMGPIAVGRGYDAVDRPDQGSGAADRLVIVTAAAA